MFDRQSVSVMVRDLFWILLVGYFLNNRQIFFLYSIFIFIFTFYPLSHDSDNKMDRRIKIGIEN